MRNSFSIQRNARRFSYIFLTASVAWCLPFRASAQTTSVQDQIVVLAPAPLTDGGIEKFSPRQAQLACEGTLELCRTADITGNQVRMRQVLRWSEADSAGFAPIADMVVDRIDGNSSRKLTLEEIRNTLRDAGVNLALVHFLGPTSCLITRHEPIAMPVPLDDHAVVEQWMEGKGKQLAAIDGTTPATQSLNPVAIGGDVTKEECNPFHTLRDRVLIDLSERLTLPVDDLQISFDPKDRAVLNLSEPTFRFQVEPRRVRDLGKVSWDVTIMSGDSEKTVLVSADARAWEREIVIAKSTAYRQVLTDDDVVERRVLVNRISDDQLLTRKQVVGQQASRDLRPGTVLTARLIDPVPLARPGEDIKITLNRGGVQIKTVAKAMESGSFGQTIKVQNELTKEVFEVTMTGPELASVGPAPDTANLASTDRDFIR